MPSIISTPGAANANSYETQAEANAYFDERLALVPAWPTTGDDAIRAILMGTRVLDAHNRPLRIIFESGGVQYYRTRRQWTGLPATTTQKLAWPRTGMYDSNGNAIAEDVIPQELKDALSELAGQLYGEDRTLDSDVSKQKITSLRAGSVALSFGAGVMPQVIPDAVLNMMPPSWFTDEIVEGAVSAEFDII